MSATVELSELDPVTRQRVLVQIGDDAAATEPQESQISQLGHLDRQALIQRLAEIQKDITHDSKRWTENKLEAGKVLLKLRESAPHGEWEPQLAEICKAAGIGRSTAHRYMDFAAGKKLVTAKTSINGYAIDELKSALQKAVRLGDEHLAMQCTVELDLSGKARPIWDSLHVFASEDVGLARLGLHREIEDLHAQWKRNHRENPSEIQLRHHKDRLFLTHAVLLLCRVQKSRLTDHALIACYENQRPIVIPGGCTELAAAEYDHHEPFEIPDVAVDKHTARGRNKLGQKGAAGINHFFDVGANLKNESPMVEDPYKESARQVLLRKTNEAA